MQQINEKDLEKMNNVFIFLRTRKNEISAKEFAQELKWKFEKTVDALKTIFDNPEKYKTLFYVLLNSDNKIFLR
ncbi:hypothetical protein COY26_05360 [Candidatus Woesearchaeota archaeon CG_4_10_14_0_2_um_filter_33_10]|nr:MAG: hypothetical protein COV14_04105 [Candidatus Woesearchaeota archaeon CG10_big_fil_rev_8_21_14_0_10_33_12]PIU72498.1 MAG: hypothetical protein COS79_02630 [Candidatus Woesearchaeota archaeon CG06_land_8_20_14_3_00_33_13]PIZ51953.1 MAG: hypothetical protein COY26_05360 [Candidatus Woesearchaeota archaeon CG_4_10_14_0_2_um_filter_33_10]